MSLILSGTDGLSDVDGSAATPAIRGTDANTGIFFPAADTIAFSEGGVEAMRLDSAGNMGLGVTPSAWNTGGRAIEVRNGGNALYCTGTNTLYQLSNSFLNSAGDFKYSSTNFATLYTQYNGTHSWSLAPSGTAGNTVTFTQAMTLDASGRLGIGPTTPANVLDVSGASGSLARFKSTGNYSTVIADNTSTTGGGAFACYKQGAQIGLFGVSGAILGDTSADIAIFAETGSSLKFYTNGSGTVKAILDTSGNLLVGTTSSSGSFRLQVKGDFSGTYGHYVGTTTAAGYMMGFYSSSSTQGGYIYVSGSTCSYVSNSDYRLKNTIAPMTDALAKVALLKPCTYKWNADGSDGQGFIAHELQAIVPDAVVGEKDAVDAEGKPVYQGIDTSFLVATLTAAIQEQQALITTLTARITALENK